MLIRMYKPYRDVSKRTNGNQSGNVRQLYGQKRKQGKSKSSGSKEGNETPLRRLNTLETDLESTFL